MSAQVLEKGAKPPPPADPAARHEEDEEEEEEHEQVQSSSSSSSSDDDNKKDSSSSSSSSASEDSDEDPTHEISISSSSDSEPESEVEDKGKEVDEKRESKKEGGAAGSKRDSKKKKKKHEISDADELRKAGLVSAYAKLDGDTSFSSRKPKYPLNLEWRHISYKVVVRLPPKNFFLRQMLRLPIPEMLAKYVKTKKVIPILNDISGIIETGKMIAIMGPTGSGKTTLLNVLARRAKMNVTGDILINGEEVQGRRMKRRMAYVLQDDVFFGNITVRDTLTCTAQLKLPLKLGMKEKKRRVDEVISEVGLNRCQNTIIGGPFQRGISGGERKRTNIANEIVNNSSLIFLDEPTTGLDAATAMGLIVTLKNLAHHGHTIVTTIHQPSSAMFMLFDRVLLLAEGGYPVYHGAARDIAPYFNSLDLKMPNNYNPADFMLELVTTKEKVDDGRVVKQYLMDKYQELKDGGSKYLIADVAGDKKLHHDKHKHLKFLNQKNNYKPPPDEDDREEDEKQGVKDMKKGHKWPTPFWWQVIILAIRAFKQRRSEILNWQMTFQFFTIAIIIGLLWLDTGYDESDIRSRTGLLFFATMFWTLNSWIGSLYAFPTERGVINRERATGTYRLSAYFCAKTLAELPLELIMPFCANTIIYWMSGLNRDGYTYILFLVLTWLFVIFGSSCGLLLSAYFVDIKKAITLTIVLVLSSVLLGGFFVSRATLHVWIVWARWISFIKYTYEALLLNEFDLPKETFTNSAQTLYQTHPIQYYEILDNLGVETKLWADFIFIIGVILVTRFGAYLCLRFLNKVKM